MKKVRAALEFFKSIVLFVLIISMALLSSIYIASTQSERLGIGNDINFDRLFNVNGDASEFNSGHILPEIIGIKKSGEAPRAMIANSAYISDMYERLMPWLVNMFGKNSTCEELADDDADALWEECLFADNYIYVRYHTQFPYSVLYAHCDDTDENDIYVFGEDGETYVYEMFLVDDALVSRDKNGKVVKFTKEKSEMLTLPDFERYMSRLVEFSFAVQSDEFSSIYGGTPIFDDSIIVKKVTADNFVMNEFGNTSGEKFRELMMTFDFNPDKLNSYIDTEERNASMYVESHGVLKMSTLKIEYTASADGGISVMGFLNYHTGSSGYDPYDYLRAAEHLADTIRRISPTAFGGDATLGISYIGYRDGVFVVEYSYYYENLPISYGDDNTALKIEIENDNFVHILIKPISVSYSDSNVRSYSQKIALAIGLGKFEGVSLDKLNMSLKYKIPSAVDTQASAEWEIVKN